MIALNRDCIDAEQIRRALGGEMSGDQFESVLAHLDHCEACRIAAESQSLAGGPSWIGRLDNSSSDVLQSESACQIAVGRLLERSFDASGEKRTRGSSAEAPWPAPDSLQQLGPYRLIEPLGFGGMGMVYLAEHERLKRKVAIKLLQRERVGQPEWLERFEREMTSIAALEHPNVVRATDAGHQDGWHYLVMEYVDGLDVGRISDRLGRLRVVDACAIIHQAALGLAHVHAFGLVHRDIKPSNLMLSRRGDLKLLDLGLVLAGDDPLGVEDRLTTVGHLMGTLPYMAPEQLGDSRQVDSRTDLYSLGATLYRLLAGHSPHQRRGGLASQVLAITGTDPAKLRVIRPEVPVELESLVSQLLAREPTARPASATSVAESLERIQQASGDSSPADLKALVRAAFRRRDDQPVRPLSLGVALAPKPPRRRWWRSAIVAAGLGGAMILAGFLIKIQTDRGELVIASDRDDVTVNIRQGGELVEQVQLEAGADNRFTLRQGTYQVEISGADAGIHLNSNVATILRGQEARMRVKESEPSPSSAPPTTEPNRAAIAATPEAASELRGQASAGSLYNGKTYETWMEALQREKDPQTLGTAMVAIATLSSGSESRQTEAARATLAAARWWGGTTVGSPPDMWGSFRSSNDNPSQTFMAYLHSVYHHYLPQPGIDALANELQQGNDRSRVASMWLLENALGGVVDHSENPSLKRTMEEWLRSTNNDASTRQTIDELLGTIDAAVKATEADTDEQVFMERIAGRVGVKLVLLTNRRVSQVPWVAEYVKDRLQEASQSLATVQAATEGASETGTTMMPASPGPAAYEAGGGYSMGGMPSMAGGSSMAGGYGMASEYGMAGGYGMGGGMTMSQPTAWVLDDDVLAAAFKLWQEAQEDRSSGEAEPFEPPWDVIMATLVHPTFVARQTEPIDVREVLSSVAPEVQIEMADQIGHAIHDMIGLANVTGVDINGASLTLLGGATEHWSMLLPFYAEHARSPEEAKQQLAQARDMMKFRQVERWVPGDPYALIDAAIATLEKRLENGVEQPRSEP